MKFRNPFKKNNYASSYYGKGNKPLVSMPMTPIQDQEEQKPVLDISQVRVPYPRPVKVDWEQRRFDLVRVFMQQERKSVVLGKSRATVKQMAEKARAMADAAIKELQTHPFESEDDEGGEKTDV